MVTAENVAAFMAQRLEEEKGMLIQARIADEISKKFGGEFLYPNENDNLAIDKEVLEIFRDYTPHVVWSRGDHLWRNRKPSDPDGRAVD